MRSPIHSRLSHWRQVLQLAWRYLWVVPFTFITGLTWLRDEWLKPEQAARWKLPAMIPGPWYYWLIATLALLLIFVLEGSYRASKREGESDTEAGSIVPSVRLTVGTGAGFEAVVTAGVNRARIVRAKIFNGTGSLIVGGRLDLLRLDPPYRDNKDYLIRSEIVIDKGKHVFVDVASYTEGTSTYPAGTWMNLCVPAAAAAYFNAIPLLPIQRHAFYLKFSTPDGLSSQTFCQLFVDDRNILHLEEWNGQTAILSDTPYVTLYEAARLFIDSNIGIYDAAARELSGDDPIGWWAYWIALRTQIYGKFLPSRAFRPFPMDGYAIVTEGENLAALEKGGGKGKWTDLSILASDIPRLIEEAKKASGLI
jgi:hypothetical protein